MPPKKLAGVCIAMVGIVWYSMLQLQAASGRKTSSSGGTGRVSAAGGRSSSGGGSTDIGAPAPREVEQLLPVSNSKGSQDGINMNASSAGGSSFVASPYAKSTQPVSRVANASSGGGAGSPGAMIAGSDGGSSRASRDQRVAVTPWSSLLPLYPAKLDRTD